MNFKGEAREADIRMLLVEVHGSLAAGPGQLGDYYVRVPAAQVAAVSDKFKASGIVDAVAVVDALPARPLMHMAMNANRRRLCAAALLACAGARGGPRPCPACRLLPARPTSARSRW